MALTIRGYFGWLSLLTTALLLATVVTIAATTIRLERSSTGAIDKLELVRAVEELWSALLYHEMRRLAFEETGAEEHAAELARMQGEIPQRLETLRRLGGGVRDPGELAQVIAVTEAYLRQPGPARGTEETTGSALEQERQLILAFTQHQINTAEASLFADRRWGQFARWVGVGAILVLALTLTAGLRSARRRIVLPLQAVNEAMLRFRPGVTTTAAPEDGVAEVRNIARVFNETADRVQGQREASLKFIAGVAHDLRNPLGALKLVVGSMRRTQTAPLDEKTQGRLALIDRQVELVVRMVQDLLDASQIESGHLSLTFVDADLVALARDVVEVHRPTTTRHDLVTSFAQASVPVHCDATRITQVLHNLLSNAIKYSPEGGPIRVEVGGGGEGAWVSVTDSGVGIPPAELGTIFEPFRRGTPGSDIPGVGLGLSVARRIVEAHQGSIEVESLVGQGTTFRVRLPTRPAVA